MWMWYLHPTGGLQLCTDETTLPRSHTAWPLLGKGSLPCLQHRGEHRGLNLRDPLGSSQPLLPACGSTKESLPPACWM